MLRFMGSQRVGHNRATELNWTEGKLTTTTNKNQLHAWSSLSPVAKGKKKGHLITVANNLASLRQSMSVVWITTLESLYNIWSKLFLENPLIQQPESLLLFQSIKAAATSLQKLTIHLVVHSPSSSKYSFFQHWPRMRKRDCYFPYLEKGEMEVNHSGSKRIQRHVGTGLQTLLEQTVLALGWALCTACSTDMHLPTGKQPGKDMRGLVSLDPDGYGRAAHLQGWHHFQIITNISFFLLLINQYEMVCGWAGRTALENWKDCFWFQRGADREDVQQPCSLWRKRVVANTRLPGPHAEQAPCTALWRRKLMCCIRSWPFHALIQDEIKPCWFTA